MNLILRPHLTLSLLIFLFVQTVFAGVRPELELPLPPQGFEEISKETIIQSSDVAKVIPLTIEPTHDSIVVATKIVDHSIQQLFNSSSFRKSAFGKTTTQVEKVMKTNVTVEDEESEIRHVFGIEMLALQNTATIKYEGLLTARLIYKVGDPNLKIELLRALDPVTDLFFNQKFVGAERVNQLNLRWKW